MGLTVRDISPAPWSRGDWTGSFVSIDGTAATDFSEEDVAEVVAWGETGDGWDGDTAGVVRLKDGRYVGWEAMYGPTGDGFSCDAYGGTADIGFAATESAARSFISERGQSLLVTVVG